MSDGAQWVTLLFSIIVVAVVCAAVGMWIVMLVEWARAKIHRYKTRRQRYTWK